MDGIEHLQQRSQVNAPSGSNGGGRHRDSANPLHNLVHDGADRAQGMTRTHSLEKAIAAKFVVP